MSTSLQKAIVMELLNVTKAEEGQKKMIFGRPFHYAGSKWVPDKAGPKEETPKKRSTRSHLDSYGESQGKEDILFYARNSGIDMSEDNARKTYEAVNSYCANSTKYRSIQQGLRKAKSREEQDSVNEDIENIEKMFSYFPIYKDNNLGAQGSKIYRGVSLRSTPNEIHPEQEVWDEEKVKKVFGIGNSVDMKGLSSWTSKKDIAEDFSRTLYKTIGIVFLSDNKSGISIKSMSDHQGEDEILHSSKTKWKVKDVRRPVGKDIYLVILDEM